VALYQAKAAGKNRYEIFHPRCRPRSVVASSSSSTCAPRSTDEQFRLVYQPIYNLDDLTSSAWRRCCAGSTPPRGSIQPDEFIPILEQTGQIREVGRWVLREACAQMAAWHARGDTLDVSVNVSGANSTTTHRRAHPRRPRPSAASTRPRSSSR
jgi:EAL domain-containing protein (putative c-di-GMP-specific phosphodiesterase class I)